MAKDKDDILQANTGAPAANIPDLKKKEKERKKAGAAWSGARGAASEFSGATGGTVARAAASAASEGAAELAAEAAAESGGLFSNIARFFANIAESLGMGDAWAAFTASSFGRMAIAAAAFLMVAAAGILGYALLKGNGSANLGNPNLGGIADSMHVRAGGDDRFGAKGGELRFDPLTQAKPAPAAPPKEEKAADEKPAPKPDMDAEKAMATGQLAHNLSGAQLSSSLGGGGFGSKDIFAGNSNAPKFGEGMLGLKKYPGAAGKLGKMQASSIHATPSARSVNKASANKAFGQLRLAKGLSQQGASSSSAEQAAADSQGAFDQQQPTNGNLATNGAPGGDTPPSLGQGAPDTSIPNAPSDPTGGGTNQALQNAMQQISDMANKGMQDIQSGTMMMTMGALLIGAGVALLFWPMTAVGLALIAAGAALVMMGMMKISQGKQEIAQAEQMGQQLAQQIGNQQQATAINACTSQMSAAANSGSSMTASQCQTDQAVGAQQESTQDQSDIQRVHQIPVGTAKVITN
ncbi:MAG TPA: hypothetical protein VN915_09000 [Elusimicrobiota bacterium]|nr:hypothetical protein [Elusimicrobiota bacterium]